MRTAILFNLDNGGAILGDDNGEIRYVSNIWLEQEYFGKLSKDGPKVIRAHLNTKAFVMPQEIEPIELRSYVVLSPEWITEGYYRFLCGYGKRSNTWVIQGTVEKIN